MAPRGLIRPNHINAGLFVKLAGYALLKCLWLIGHRIYLENMKIGYAPKIPNKGDCTRILLKNDGPH